MKGWLAKFFAPSETCFDTFVPNSFALSIAPVAVFAAGTLVGKEASVVAAVVAPSDCIMIVLFLLVSHSFSRSVTQCAKACIPSGSASLLFLFSASNSVRRNGFLKRMSSRKPYDNNTHERIDGPFGSLSKVQGRKARQRKRETF